MKRSITAFCCLFLLIPALAEDIDKEYSGIICLDVSAAIRSECLRIIIGHPIGLHWSAGGYAGVNLGCFKRNLSDEETQHKDELDINKNSNAYTGSFHAAAFIRFWHSSPHNGLFLSTGFRFEGEKRQDITAGIGYSMMIWRNIIAEISYEIDIIDTYHNSIIKGDKAGINIGITF